MKKCKVCEEVKELKNFYSNGIYYRGRCKLCHLKRFYPPTGKVNTGRFKKGDIPWIKGKKAVKRTEPRYKKIRGPLIDKSRTGLMSQKWGLSVKERDGFKCQLCQSEGDLVSHHKIRWEDDEDKRFDIENGVTMCRSCHSRHHRLLETANRKNK